MGSPSFGEAGGWDIEQGAYSSSWESASHRGVTLSRTGGV